MSKSCELGKEDAVALSTVGFALVIVVGDIIDGVAMIDRALLLNPNRGIDMAIQRLCENIAR
jgi:hypothetical protein